MYNVIKEDEIIDVFRKILLGRYYNKNSKVIDFDMHPELSDAIGGAVSLLAETKKPEKDNWPRNLLLDIGIVPLNEDFPALEKNLYIAIDTINEVYKRTILLYYKEGKRLKDCSAEMQISVSTVLSHIGAGISLLKRKERVNLICGGEELARTSQALEQELISEIKRIKEQLEKNDIPAVKNVDDESIAILGLSNRPLFALRRHGISSMSMLRRMSRDRLLMMKGLGKQSADEIIEKASIYGIIIPDHDEMIG